MLKMLNSVDMSSVTILNVESGYIYEVVDPITSNFIVKKGELIIILDVIGNTQDMKECQAVVLASLQIRRVANFDPDMTVKKVKKLTSIYVE